MKKSETFWPCAGSTASVVAFVFILDYSIPFLSGHITEAYHSAAQVFGFVAIAGPITAVILLTNHAVLSWRYRTAFPLLGFVVGVPLAIPTVFILGVMGMVLSSSIRWVGVESPKLGMTIALILSVLLAGLGIKHILELYKETKVS